MKCVRVWVVVCVLGLAGVVGVQAQSAAAGASTTPASASMLRLIKFSGSAADAQGRALQGTVGVTFALYADQQGGSPLWVETQNVTLDKQGRYTALLGAMKNEGLPLAIFSSGEARWLGITVQGQAEQPRVLLVAVPYALKAAEAETLSGKKASDFVTTEQLPEQVQKVMEEQKTGSSTASTSSTTTSGAGGKAVVTSGATNFTDTTTDQVVKVTQNGTGYALLGVGTASNGIFGATQAANANVYGLFGQTIGDKGGAVIGFANSTTGTAVGVQGVTKSATGTAGAFVNTAGGTILLGRGAGNAEVFRVSGDGSLVLQGSGGGAGGLVVKQNANSPNLVGGYAGNTVGMSIVGATIGGGGQGASVNQVTGTFGTVAGGQGNSANGLQSTVSGGNTNTASGADATVSGGTNNSAAAGIATVGGGNSNIASGVGATVGGGSGNTASSNAATVGGGTTNTAGGDHSTIAGGDTNLASMIFSTIGGGTGNTASGMVSTVGGGFQNTASGDTATVSGGESNTASGSLAAVSGGLLNTAAGNTSFAAGSHAKALHDGAFVWGDSTPADVSSSANNQVTFRAAGGFRVLNAANTQVFGIDNGGNVEAGGNLKFGPSAALFAEGGPENLRVVRGRVASDGSVAEGSGFSANHPGTGVYNVLMSAGFNGTTSPVVIPFNTSPLIPVIVGLSSPSGGFAVEFFDTSGTLTDTQFIFIAAGPR